VGQNDRLNRLPKAGDPISAQQMRILIEAVRRSLNVVGLGAFRSSTGLYFAAPKAVPGDSVIQFWGKLSNMTSLGDNRWSYDFLEQVPDLDGTFKDAPNGRSGICYNTLEAFNTASGIQGSGDNTADFPGGVELQPIGGGVVRIYQDVDCNGDPIFLFQAPNNPGGNCEGGE
jgi:hypothetical protein